jgi:ribA/ribD-fused uncharacterized protein
MNTTLEERVYSRAESIVFRKTNEQFGGLSNMAPGYPLEVNGIRIASAEALYQACRFPGAPHVQKIIFAASSPMTAKMRSKRFRKTDSRLDWDAVRVSVMRWCLRVKLAQNWEKFDRLLAATNDKPIVEESSKDRFWGAKPTDDSTLVGSNVLGRLLMELRKELNERSPESLATVPPLHIPNFLLLGIPIGVIRRREIGPLPPKNAPNAPTETDNLLVSYLASGDDKAKIDEIFSQVEESGLSQIVQDLNRWRVTAVKLKGTYSPRAAQDELVLVLKGSLRVHLQGRDLPLNAGELFVVRRGSGSFSISTQGADFLLLEPKSASDVPQMMLYSQA